jgi:hypothetical protein
LIQVKLWQLNARYFLRRREDDLMRRKQLTALIAASTALLVGGGILAAPPPEPGTKPPGGGPPPWAGPPEWAGGPKEPVECETPDISSCVWDDFLEELYAEWNDIQFTEAVCTKYGGDLELEVDVWWECDDPASQGEFTLSIEVDLDRDPAAPLSYECDGSACVAMINYADLFSAVDGAVAEQLAGPRAACITGWDSGYSDYFEDPYPLFSVKQMNPGPGMGRQNRVKDYEDCVSSGA